MSKIYVYEQVCRNMNRTYPFGVKGIGKKMSFHGFTAIFFSSCFSSKVKVRMKIISLDLTRHFKYHLILLEKIVLNTCFYMQSMCDFMKQMKLIFVQTKMTECCRRKEVH